MKPISISTWPIAAILATQLFYASLSNANEVLNTADEAQTMPFVSEIPTDEKAFVEAINKFDKQKIVELLGEPARAEDVKIKGTGKVAASIWHYHNINTDENGVYYPTTELDFIDDKVVTVVFLNNDGSDANDGKTKDGKTYEVPNVQSN
jgi:hypothetical protein